MEKDGDDSNENQHSADELKSLSKNNNESPPSPPSSSLSSTQATSNPFLSPSKLSLLQTIGNLQQQQLFQQAALSAIAPQLSQQINAGMNLGEAEAKFREFAFKTMQELLNIYGLGLSTNDIVDVLKQQQPQHSVGKWLWFNYCVIHSGTCWEIERAWKNFYWRFSNMIYGVF